MSTSAPSSLLHLVGPFAWAERVRVTGEDAHAFLQSQFAADLGRGVPRELTWSLRLDASGHVRAAAWVLGPGATGDGSWLLLVEHGEPGALRSDLETFVIADDVAMEDVTSGCSRALVQGSGVAEWLASLPEGSGSSRFLVRPASGLVAFPSRSFPGAVEVDGPVASIKAWVEQFARERGAAVEGLPDHDARILAGIPLVPVDLGPTDLPQEGGLEGEDGYGLRKGCYLGQEVMARLSAQGRVRRSLHRVQVRTGVQPSSGARVMAGALPVGELRSVACRPSESGFAGLAMLKEKALAPGAGALQLEPCGSPVEVVGRVVSPTREAAP